MIIEEEITELAHYYYLLGRKSLSRRFKEVSKIIFKEATNLRMKPIVIINEVQNGGFLLTVDFDSGKDYMIKLISANLKNGNLLKPSAGIIISEDGRCMQPFSLSKLPIKSLPNGITTIGDGKETINTNIM